MVYTGVQKSDRQLSEYFLVVSSKEPEQYSTHRLSLSCVRGLKMTYAQTTLSTFWPCSMWCGWRRNPAGWKSSPTLSSRSVRPSEIPDQDTKQSSSHLHSKYHFSYSIHQTSAFGRRSCMELTRLPSTYPISPLVAYYFRYKSNKYSSLRILIGCGIFLNFAT